MSQGAMFRCKMRTESYDDRPATWEEIVKQIQTLDDPNRGTAARDGAFLTIWFEDSGTDDEFMQCMPEYPKQKGLMNKLFGSSKNVSSEILSYIIEVSTGEKIYQKHVTGKEQLVSEIVMYYETQNLPDTSEWTDSGIL